MKKLYTDKRWNDDPKAEVVGKSKLSKKELKERAIKMKKELLKNREVVKWYWPSKF